MPRSLIAVILLSTGPAAQPLWSMTAQQMQARLSGCQASKSEAQRLLRRLQAAPDKHENVAETTTVLNTVIADADECIAEYRPKVQTHLEAEERRAAAQAAVAKMIPAAPTARAPRIQRMRSESAKPRIPLGKTYMNIGFALAGNLAYLGAAALWPALFPVTIGIVFTMGVGLLLATVNGLYSDFTAFSTEEAHFLRRYHDGNRDQEFVRTRGIHER